MQIFKPKKGAVLTQSRLWHFALASAVTAGGGHFLGYEGGVICGFGMVFFGFAWEVFNKWLAGYHPFGDAIDFYAFVAGVLASGTATALLTA